MIPVNNLSQNQSGSKVKVWAQDPSVVGLDATIRTVYMPQKIQSGPRNSDAIVQGITPINSDVNGDFLLDVRTNRHNFAAMHTFTIVNQVINMYRRVLKKIGHEQPLNWQWGSLPISIFPFAGVERNAYYSPQERCLKFFYFTDRYQQPIFTCESTDIVAHETGHAVLDSLRPGYMRSINPQTGKLNPETGALNESFADLTAIFYMLSQMDICEDVTVHSAGDLHNKTYFQSIGEQFGKALGREEALRDADNDLTLRHTSKETHDLSKVFTGAVYDILSDMFDSKKDFEREPYAETLYNLGGYLCGLLTKSILNGPKYNASFFQIACNMINFEPNPSWKSIIYKQFATRGVISVAQNAAPAVPTAAPAAASGVPTTYSITSSVGNSVTRSVSGHVPLTSRSPAMLSSYRGLSPIPLATSPSFGRSTVPYPRTLGIQ